MKLSVIFPCYNEFERAKDMFEKYKSILAYLFFGVCTTIVNIVAYYLFSEVICLSTASSTSLAWLLAVLFAFVTNKLWVFNSCTWNRKVVLRELVSFMLCRIATGILDLGIMIFTVDFLYWNGMLMKVLSNILVIILNYAASKLLIFRKQEVPKT